MKIENKVRNNLDVCPFCGQEAEIYKERLFPRCKRSFKSQSEAESFLDEVKRSCEVVDSGIWKKQVGRYGQIDRYQLWYDKQAYIPRCTQPRCPGRNVIMYGTEEEAIFSWNRRAEDV